MDQWDWFTVYTQLGHPTRGLAKTIGEALAEVRMSARDCDENGLRPGTEASQRNAYAPLPSLLLGRIGRSGRAEAGWIYILSTREMRDLLKLGMTTRTVLEWVREINNAAGVPSALGAAGA